MSPLPELSRTSELKAPFATILVYGLARAGKTHLARTCPKPLILATEIGDTRGLQTIKDIDIPYLGVDDWPTMELVIAELNKVPGKCQYKGEEFETVIVDSLTMCGDLWLKLALKMLGRTEVGMAAPGWDPRRPFGYVAEKGRQGMKAFMSLRAHLLCLAREGSVEEEVEDGTSVQVPCIELPGAKLYKELPGWPDATLRIKMVNNKRMLVTTTENRAIAGIRTALKLPRYIIPDIGLVIKAMMGDVDAVTQLDPTPPKTAAATPSISRR